jgi:sugar lactone lactonase YvrE
MVNGWSVFLFITLVLNGMGSTDAQGVAADFALTNDLSEPRGIAVDEANRVFYVADALNHRVLRYDSMDTISATSWPAAVFGQLDFAGRYANQGLSTPSQGSLCYPWGLWVDAASTLWVADTGNGRVVWWANAHALGNGSLATGYVGQASWTNVTSGPDYLLAPTGVVTGPDGTLG